MNIIKTKVTFEVIGADETKTMVFECATDEDGGLATYSGDTDYANAMLGLKMFVEMVEESIPENVVPDVITELH